MQLSDSAHKGLEAQDMSRNAAPSSHRGVRRIRAVSSCQFSWPARWTSRNLLGVFHTGALHQRASAAPVQLPMPPWAHSDHFRGYSRQDQDAVPHQNRKALTFHLSFPLSPSPTLLPLPSLERCHSLHLPSAPGRLCFLFVLHLLLLDSPHPKSNGSPVLRLPSVRPRFE